MPPSITPTNWRDDLELSLARVASSVDAEIAQTRDSAKAEGARTIAESLNQAIRRMRQTTGPAEVLSLLIEAAAPFSSRAAALVLDATRARISAMRGFVAPEIQFDLEKAAAVLAAIESKDPVAAAVTTSEFSPELCAAVTRDLDVGERGYLYPIVVNGSVSALLFALGNVQAAPLELLSEAAAMRLEVLDAKPRGSVSESGATSAQVWNDLSSTDQALHLKAQRFARVAVAEMRLARQVALREGRKRLDIYTALRPEIDAARETFRKDFVASTPTMVDYLYIELLRSLANDDDKLLGSHFPGRLI